MAWKNVVAGVGSVGFKRAGDRMKALPDRYTIVGGPRPCDKSAEELLRLYSLNTAKHRRARAIILGARDRLRVAAPPPRAFIETCANGIIQDVGAADLGPDKDGVVHVVLLVGRQRIMSRSILDAEGAKKKPREPPLEVTCVLRAFPPGADFDLELAALEANIVSNAFVAMTPSATASHAEMLSQKGMRNADIAVKIGAFGEDHVAQLLFLAKCDPCVYPLVDGGKMALAECETMSKRTPEEQARLCDRKLAGNSKAAKDKAGAPNPKTPPAKFFLAAATAATAATSGVTDGELALFAFFAGDMKALKNHASLLAVAVAAGFDPEKEKIRLGPNARTTGRRSEAEEEPVPSDAS